MSNNFKLAVVGGDGIGPEVTAEALKVLRAAVPDVTFDVTDYDLGARRWHRTGETLPGATAPEFVPNMLFALEPLVWVEDSGGVGVRIEDMILVTDSGPRVLSRVEYDETLLG